MSVYAELGHVVEYWTRFAFTGRREHTSNADDDGDDDDDDDDDLFLWYG